MSTEDEVWRDAEEHSGASNDGNQFDKEDYGHTSGYRPQRSFNEGGRSPRPRFNPNASDGVRREGSYGSRPYRPRFENDGDARPQRAYSSDRPQRAYSSDRPQRSYGDRPQRSNYNRPYRSYSNEESGERPYRPRYNSEGGERTFSSDRPQHSYGDRPQRSYGDRPQRSYSSDRPQRSYGDRSQRPRFQQGDGKTFGGGQRRFQQNGRRPQTPDAKYSRKKQIEYKEQFVDPNEPIRLNKFLANAGVCSRREADDFITAGVVTVNGVVVNELGTKIKRGDKVMFHDQPVSIERKIYILLNKPKDTVTTSDDPQARKTVLDLVKNACPERIYPVGRLDRNTTGVLLLTNDGDLASKLTHPKYLKKKIYQVTLDKKLTRADMDQIASGIQLEDGEIHADAISYPDEEKKQVVGIEIHSGRNRIVRRIFESLGYKVVKLDRVYFAGLTKKGLRRGDWRFLTDAEVNFLRMGSFE